MAAQSQYVYEVKVDLASARKAAGQVKNIFQGTMGQITLDTTRVTSGITQLTNQVDALQKVTHKKGGENALGGLLQLHQIQAAISAVRQLSQVVQTVGRAGIEGANIETISRSFFSLAEGAEMAGDSLLGKLTKATQKTVSNFELMSRSNLLLVAAQKGEIKVTEQQIATLGKFARLRATQLTMEGKPLTTGEAYSRLIRGIVKRETELLDELGISTKQLADILNVPLNQVNKNVETLLESVLKVAEIDIKKFGAPIEDTAQQIAEAQASIENSMNMIREAAAEPVKMVLQVVAPTAEAIAQVIDEVSNELKEEQRRRNAQDSMTIGFGQALRQFESDEWFKRVFNRLTGMFTDQNQDRILGVENRLQNLPRLQNAQPEDFTETIEAISELGKIWLETESLMSGGLIPQAQGQEILGIWEAIVSNWERGNSNLAEIQEWTGKIKEDLGTARDYFSELGTDEGRSTRLTEEQVRAGRDEVLQSKMVDLEALPIAQFIEAGEAIETLAKAGVSGADELQTRYEELSSAMITMATQTDPAARGIWNVINALNAAALLGDVAALTSKTFGPQAGQAIAGNVTARLPSQAGDSPEFWTGALADLYKDQAKAQADLAKNQEDDRQRAARMAEVSAKEAQAAWEKAANEAAARWKEVAGAILGAAPGTRSPVTKEQMEAAEAGIPQRFFDSFLREVEDEAINKVDRPNVDLNALKELIGMDAGTPNNVFFNEFERQYTSRELFANPEVQANIGQYVDFEAAGEDVRRFKLSEEGIAFIDQKLKEQLGDLDYAGYGETISGGFSGIFSGSEGDKMVNLAIPLISNFKSQMGEEKSVNVLRSIGGSMASEAFLGFGEAIPGQPWAITIANGIKADLAALISSMNEGS